MFRTSDILFALVIVVAFFFLTQMVIAVSAPESVALAQIVAYKEMLTTLSVAAIFIACSCLLVLIAIVRSKSEAAQRIADRQRNASIVSNILNHEQQAQHQHQLGYDMPAIEATPVRRHSNPRDWK